jgi:outer membrane immunogenic protein
MRAPFIGFVAAFALAVHTASAADLGLPVKPVSAPPPLPAVNWTGCYASGGGGYGMWNQDNYFEAITPAVVPISANATNGGRGWFGLAGGGCDYRLNLLGVGLVVGAFGDFDFMHLHGSFVEPTNFIVADENERWAWAAGARIGYLVTPTVLTYVNGGYTETHFDQMNFSFAAAPPFDTGVVLPGQTYRGWFIGGGMEFALTILPIPGFFWRNEYRYSTYQSADLTYQVLGTTVPFAEHMRPQVQTLATEIVYKLNWTP